MTKQQIVFILCVLAIAIGVLFYVPKANTPKINNDPIPAPKTQVETQKNDTEIIMRENVSDEYKWKLSDIFKSESDIEKSLEKAKSDIEKLALYKGKLGDEVKLLEYLQLNDSYQTESDKCYLYANLGSTLDISDSKMDALMQKIYTLDSIYQQKVSFATVEIKALSDAKMSTLINNPKFANYKKYFRDIIKQKQHILNQDQEDVLAQLSDAYIPFSTTYSKLIDGDIIYPEITNPQGAKIKANYGNMYTSWNNPDRNFRKEYTNAFYSTYKSYKNALGALVISNIKEITSYAKIRKYASVLETKYLQKDLPESIYTNLINTTRQNLDVFHRYLKIRQDYLGLDKTHYYDTFLPIEKDVNTSFSYTGAKEMVVSGLSKLGTGYTLELKKAFDSNWIDVYQGKNKNGGAFANGVLGTHPFISLGFNNDYESVSILAHELGHAMNLSFSQKQPYMLFGTQFPVEVPSITNELLMLRGAADSAASDKEKLYYLDRYLSLIYTNYWRATMYGDYEKQIYEKAWKGESITADTLEKTFEELFKTYYGPNFVYDDYLNIEWAIKPHFFNSYYTHEYAVSAVAANEVAGKILAKEPGFAEKYMQYLSLGNSLKSDDALAIMGIDMNNPEFILSMKNSQTKILDEIEQIISRIKASK